MDDYKERLKKVTSLADLKCRFELYELVEMTRDHLLEDWLNFDMRVETELNKLLSAMDCDDDELRLLLCEALEWDIIHDLSATDALAIERALEKRRFRAMYVDEDVSHSDYVLARNQAELMHFLENEPEVVYLLPNEYRLPRIDMYHQITYVGIQAVICIDSSENINLDEAGIVFKGDVKIFLKNDICLTMNDSPGIEVVNFHSSSLNGNIEYRDICRALQGREPFEPQEAFVERIAAIKGIVVGDVLFQAEAYDGDKNVYKLYPHWRIDYMKQAREMPSNDEYYLDVDFELASRLFSERKMLLYADFEALGDKVSFANLYLVTKAGEYIYIKSRSIVGELENAVFSSGGGGYGMNLIYNNPDLINANYFSP